MSHIGPGQNCLDRDDVSLGQPVYGPLLGAFLAGAMMVIIITMIFLIGYLLGQ